MRKTKIKKFSLATLCIGVLGCLAGGIYAQGVSMSIGAHAEIAAGDFYIYSAGIRLVNDKNGTGLRFQTRINKTTYDGLQSANSVSKTGTLILPEILYQNNLTVDNTSALNIDTTDLWALTEDKTELYSIAYVYDIPVANYGSKLLATSYVAYTDGTVEYTAISPATSMMDVAKTAPVEKAEQVAPYLVENVTIKYKNADGSLLSTETLKYGEKLTPPVVDVPDGYKFGGWCMKNGTAWDFEKWTAQGNVALQATFEKYQGKYVIAESAYETGIDVGGGSQFEATTEIAAAKGFDNVYKYQSSTQANIHGMYFSSADLTKYSKVFFALKTARFNFNSEATKDTNDWMYFALTQTSTATWDLTVTCNGETIYEKTGLNGAYNSVANPAYSNNALDAILFGNPNGFYPMAVDGDLTVYVSEVRGMPGEGFAITQDAVLDGSAFTGTTVDTSVAAPEGYTIVSTRTNFRGSSGAGSLEPNTYSRTDMSAYSEVSFKTLTNENYYVIAGAWMQDVSGWVEWKFVKNSTGWTLTITDSQGNVWLTKELTGTSLATLLGASDAEANSGAGIYVEAGGGQQVWVTELRGKVETNYESVEVATDKILTDSTLTAETAPAGYEKVYTMTSKTTVSSGSGTELATVSGLDISKYVKLTYQIKVSDSWVLYNGWGHYYEGNNTWQEVTVSKTASGWSVTFGGTTTDKTGNKLSDILVFEMDARKYTDCNPSVIHITELKGYVDLSYTEELPEMTPVEGVKIAEGAYEVGVDVGGGSQFDKTTEIAPAKGFENVYKYQSTADMIHGKSFCGVDLTKYSQVSFALKTAKFNFNNEATQEFSDWAYFTLTQTSTATWNLSVTYNGAIVYTKAGLNGAYATNENYNNNALDAILFGNPNGFYPMAVDGDLTVYVSEVRGELAPIEYWGEKIVNSAVTDAVNAISEKETANGFEKVYKLSGAFGQGVFADVDITAYEEVRFYLTMNQALLLDDWSAYAYPNEGWTLVTLQNNLDGNNTWTVTLADREDASGANSFTATYTGTTLQQVLNAWYTTYDDNVLYVTDVRGVKVPAWGETVGETATIVGATQTSELQVPMGYEKLYLTNTLSTSAGASSFADVDISAYGEVRFKLKSNSYIVWKSDWSNVVMLKNNWMEFCLTQNADGTWDLFVDYGGGSYGGATNYQESGLVGTTLKAVLGKYEGSKQSEELVQRIYVTELRGEKKKRNLPPF